MNKTQTDFPAAHSMDTTWFAVDGQGNIASFDTGEAGALPNSAYVDNDFSISTWVIQLINESGHELYLDDLLVESDEKIYVGQGWPDTQYVPRLRPQANRTTEYSVLFWFNDQPGLEEVSRKTDGELLRVKHPTALLGWIDEIQPAALEKFAKSKAVKKVWVRFEFSCARIGWFAYSHGDAFENWISGPYLKDGSPQKPMKLSQLPEKIQKQVSRITLQRLNFEKDRMFNPFEHTPCGSWGAEYVDANGEVRQVEDAPAQPEATEGDS